MVIRSSSPRSRSLLQTHFDGIFCCCHFLNGQNVDYESKLRTNGVSIPYTFLPKANSQEILPLKAMLIWEGNKLTFLFKKFNGYYVQGWTCCSFWVEGRESKNDPSTRQYSPADSVGGTKTLHTKQFLSVFSHTIHVWYIYLHLLSFTIKTQPNVGKYTIFPWIRHGFLTPKESWCW